MTTKKICRECGKQMKPKLIVKGGHYKTRLERFECECGYQEAKERTTEKIENDRIDEEIKEALNKDKSEPFIEQEEI